MRNTLTSVFFAALLAGCGSSEDDTALAARLASAIAAAPNNAEAIIEADGLTEADFSALMYDIAADPKKTAAFEAARH